MTHKAVCSAMFFFIIVMLPGIGGCARFDNDIHNRDDTLSAPENTYLEILPGRVLDPSGNGPVTLAFTFETEVDRAVILSEEQILLDQIDRYRWSQNLSHSEIFQYYSAGDSFVFIGYCETYNGPTMVQRLNLFLPVRSAAMPDVDYTVLSSDMQMSDHVLNMRYDTLLLGGPSNNTVWYSLKKTIQETLGPLDYYALVGQVNAYANRTGGGVLVFPNTIFFDLANTGAVHELGHCLGLAYSNHPLIGGHGHWRLGNAATGIMGWADPSFGGEGLEFLYRLKPNNIPGTTLIYAIPKPTEFNDLELYKMGLIPAEDVEPILQFSNQDAVLGWMKTRYPLASCGIGCQVLNVASEYITIDDIIASDGPTQPAVDTHITIGTVVLSHGRLLTPDEMAFYDFMSARGEGTEPVQVQEGFSNYEGKPFNVATRGLMSVSTRIR